MRYAIIQSGGKQYKAVEGESLEVDHLGLEVGKKLELKDILLVSDGESALVGSPMVSGAKVAAKVVDQVKGPKVTIFKYHPRKRYRVKRGHRQLYTRLLIERIEAKGLAKAEAPKQEEPKAEAPKSEPAKATAPKKEAPKAAKAEAAAKKAAPTKAAEPSTRRKLSGLDLSERTVELLEGAEVSTVSQLLKKLEEGDEAVLAINGIGPKALEDIKKVLKKEGYSLPK